MTILVFGGIHEPADKKAVINPTEKIENNLLGLFVPSLLLLVLFHTQQQQQ